MALQKENVLGNMYGLRAALSVISKNYDEIQAAEAQAEKNYKQLDSDERAANEKLEASKNFYSFAKHNLNYCKSNLLKGAIGFVITAVLTAVFIVILLKLENSYNLTDKMTYISGAIFGISLFNIALIINHVFSKSYSLSRFLLIITCVLAVVGSIATVIVFLYIESEISVGVAYGGLAFGGFVVCVLLAFSFIIAIMKYLSGCLSCNVKKQHKEKELDDAYLKYNAATLAFKNERKSIAENRKRAIAPCVENVNTMDAMLKSAYKGILDERDWENVDLIIYYLETGRADDIKEALQLVDRKLQTQRIENLICDATQCIVDTLNNGFRNMQQALAIVYNGLSEQLSGISSQLSQINSNTFSAAAMNQALLAKANVTSSQMINELRTLRNNSDYARSRLA